MKHGTVADHCLRSSSSSLFPIDTENFSHTCMHYLTICWDEKQKSEAYQSASQITEGNSPLPEPRVWYIVQQ